MNTELVTTTPELLLNQLVTVTSAIDELKSQLRRLQDLTPTHPQLESWALDYQSSINTKLQLFQYACKQSGITVEPQIATQK